MRNLNSAKILLVDDNIQNLELLDAHLTVSRYNTISCTNGFDALIMAEQEQPDLIILDVMMPKIDGFEVCRKLKASSFTKMIPIIMLTALKDVDSKIKGMEAGAEEFLSKPFNKLELLTKVKSLLKIKFLHEDLENSNSDLKTALNNLKQLEDVKNDLIHMLVHDLKNPLHGISLSLSLVVEEQVGPLNLEQKEFVRDAKMGAESLLRMVNDLLDVTKMEESKMKLIYEAFNINTLISAVIDSLDIMAQENNISVTLSTVEPFSLTADKNIVERILINLLSNAIKHSYSDHSVEISSYKDNGSIVTAIKDSGEGIPPEFHSKVFEKFGHVDSKKLGYKFDTGLGLTFCKMAVEAHGGKIWLDSEPGKGSTFFFSLPISTSI